MQINTYENINTTEGNIVRLVEEIFSKALKMGASDIHIEPMANYSRIRVRLDGLLVELCQIPLVRHNAMLSRIKLLSEMDIAEKRLPQDGRLEATYRGRKIDFRVASLPTLAGEKLAIRILDKSHTPLNLGDLALSTENAHKYDKLIHAANGLVLVTGPTGSGKTTTLYATLMDINDKNKNIITVEDPIEYQLEGINQLAVQKKIGLDFATALRALVRQDPNIIMLGEIRDLASAEIAVQAAMTGHLVFSTLHTNNALGAIGRLLDIGIEPFLMLSSLRGILAQRLVRCVCPHCRTKYVPKAMERYYLGLEKDKNPDLQLVYGQGCPACHGTGYQGRMAVQELISVDDTLISMILHKETEAKQLEYLRSQGFRTLREDGMQKALCGKTTVAELVRTGLL